MYVHVYEVSVFKNLYVSAVYMRIQCTPLLMERVNVTPQVIVRFTAHMQEKEQ